jgi:phenylalanyl-tRNA synthetase alpha chain
LNRTLTGIFAHRTGLVADVSHIFGFLFLFFSLLVPKTHVSRSKHDCYYVNKNYLLRSHTSAHQSELIKSGLNSFLVIGDVYRRDEIDSTHYPVFHQCEGVRLFNKHQLFDKQKDDNHGLDLFERIADDASQRRILDPAKQPVHTLEATKLVEHDLKKCLVDLVRFLFGSSDYQISFSVDASLGSFFRCFVSVHSHIEHKMD